MFLVDIFIQSDLTCFNLSQVVMLMESKHTNVWSGHSSSQIVPHMFSPSWFTVVGFRVAVIMVFLHWLNDIPIDKGEIVKHSTARDHLRHEDRAHLQGLEEKGAPACFHHAKGLLLKQACTGLCTGFLYGVMRQMGALRQGYPPSQRMHILAGGYRLPAYTGLLYSQHPGIVHRPWTSHKDVKEFPLVISDGLELDEMKQFPVVVAMGVICWRCHADMTGIYCTDCPAESW